MLETGREREARAVARANRIEAVIRLCSGKIDDWDTFLRNTDAEELVRLDRHRLRRKAQMAKHRTRKLMITFNRLFFDGATEGVFEALFEEIKSGIPLGLRMPVSEFESRFAPLRREVSKGRDQERPFHATISITLLGLLYEYPEWHFANDIAIAITEAREINLTLAPFCGKFDPALKRKWIEAKALAQRQVAVVRWSVIACSSLIEAYLGGLAWRVQQSEGGRLSQLSSRDRKTVEDAGPSFKDRLIRIPRILTGRELWDERDPNVRAVLELKHIRDALMHPSPFSVPDKYGGKDKLSVIYMLNHDIAERSVKDTYIALKRIFQHIHGVTAPLPSWMVAVGRLVDGGG
jgi:hypothetical protein